MAEWFEFYLTALKSLVSAVFSLDTGLGFSLGDIEVALLVIGVVASALIIKVVNSVGSSINDTVSEHNSAVKRDRLSRERFARKHGTELL